MGAVRVSLGGFWRSLPRLGPEILAAISVTLTRGLAREAMVLLPQRSPVGRPPSATRRGTSRHPGKFRGSWLVSAGRGAKHASLPDRPFYPIPGPADADRSLARLRPGERVAITNDARTDGARESYAGILWRGRRRDRRGRWIGSLQAPQGLQAPLEDHLRSVGAQLMREAARAADEAGRAVIAKAGR